MRTTKVRCSRSTTCMSEPRRVVAREGTECACACVRGLPRTLTSACIWEKRVLLNVHSQSIGSVPCVGLCTLTQCNESETHYLYFCEIGRRILHRIRNGEWWRINFRHYMCTVSAKREFIDHVVKVTLRSGRPCIWAQCWCRCSRLQCCTNTIPLCGYFRAPRPREDENGHFENFEQGGQ